MWIYELTLILQVLHPLIPISVWSLQLLFLHMVLFCYFYDFDQSYTLLTWLLTTTTTIICHFSRETKYPIIVSLSYRISSSTTTSPNSTWSSLVFWRQWTRCWLRTLLVWWPWSQWKKLRATRNPPLSGVGDWPSFVGSSWVDERELRESYRDTVFVRVLCKEYWEGWS